MTDSARSQQWQERLRRLEEKAGQAVPLEVEGKLVRMVGLTLEAVGCEAAIGERCLVRREDGTCVETEVVGFAAERLLLMAIDDPGGLAPRCAVLPEGSEAMVKVGPGLLGRVIDAQGRPLDAEGPLREVVAAELGATSLNPLSRRPIEHPLDVGVRTLNALLTVGQGQRLGLFASSGVGKSMLLSMMTRFTAADVVVVALIGERGREVRDFVERILQGEAKSRAVVVAAPADDPPLMRVQGALLATRIAEYFRDQGRHVLLLMDSLTRYAHALRQVGLAVGEPPATRGYPPSVFARLPELVERAGSTVDAGTITALYTVLTEGDGVDDPVADAARAILDGHIVLSRELAQRGHFPAIDLGASVSRAMPDITSSTHQEQARKLRELLAHYHANSDVVSVGAYRKGSDPLLDQALDSLPDIMAFMTQDRRERADFDSSVTALGELFAGESGASQPR